MLEPVRPLPRLLLAAALVLGTFVAARAQSGVAVTPDRLSHLVNKDIGAERWTISLNLSASDPVRDLVTNVTGNVFREGQAPAFIVCQVQPGSTGSLADPSSVFRLSCDGSSACGDTALACSQSGWTPLVRDLELPASFFLPSDEGTANARSTSAAGPQGGASGRGATLSYDGLSYLVSKDIGGQRWSIIVNLAPRITDSGQSRNELVSVTGNVFNRDGSAPQFVYCHVLDGSQGDLGDTASTFRFRCSGSDACTGSIDECASRWSVISDSLELPAAFFLPEGGSGLVRSDPEIVVIGRTSDRSSIGTEEYTVPAGSTAAGAPGGGCSGLCLANRIGECMDVPGQLRAGATAGCFCLVEDVPASCILCGSGTVAGQCGGPCGYPVGSKTARGICLPFNALNGDCLCNAIGSSGQGAPDACGGPLAAPCSGDDRCCVDDPSDGCNPADGDAQCAGRCAGTGGCDPVTQQCGFCSNPCGNGVAEGLEACDGSDLRGASCPGSGSPACRSDCTLDTSDCGGGCGNGRIEGSEECDGQDFGGESCASLGLPPGALACSSACLVETDGCVGACTTDAPCLEVSVGSGGQCQFRDTCPGGQSCSCPGGGFACDDDELRCLAPQGPECGNGIREAGEQCDDGDLGGATCQSVGLPAGALQCRGDCTFDTSECGGAEPVVTSFECNGSASCSVPADGTPFTLEFSYVDPNGDASEWTIFLDGAPFTSGSIPFGQGGSGTVSSVPVTGVCEFACCVSTDFLFTVTVEDATGLVSDVGGPVVLTELGGAECNAELSLFSSVARGSARPPTIAALR